MFILRSLAVLLCLGGLFRSATATADPIRVPALYNTVYAPDGFDSNDHVQIVGEGMFRNTCYRHAETSVRVDAANHQIFLGPVAYEYPGLCLQVILPWERTVDIGILPAGHWDVMQGPTEKLGQLEVAPATTDNPDDFLYAPVSQAFFRQRGNISEVLLSGNFPNSCMTIDYVKITLQPKVIVLQPIAKDSSAASCKDGKFPFSKTVRITRIATGRYLLHVRSMNGNAINTLVDAK
ncbi:hypothetical protein BH10BDE1_BH10BDE1_27600 [soil metagenome]